MEFFPKQETDFSMKRHEIDVSMLHFFVILRTERALFVCERRDEAEDKKDPWPFRITHTPSLAISLFEKRKKDSQHTFIFSERD